MQVANGLQAPSVAKGTRACTAHDSILGSDRFMNAVMSGGAQRLWQRFMLSQTGLRPGARALDVDGNDGKLAAGMARQVGPEGLLVLSHFDTTTLRACRNTLIDGGIASNVRYVLAKAAQLPFGESSFDCITMSFALRRIVDKAAALHSMMRILRPGGQLLILEFAQPVLAGLQAIQDAWQLASLSLLDTLQVQDEANHRHMIEALRLVPKQDALLDMMRKAGLEQCRYHNLSGGIAALHRGYRL